MKVTTISPDVLSSGDQKTPKVPPKPSGQPGAWSREHTVSTRRYVMPNDEDDQALPASQDAQPSSDKLKICIDCTTRFVLTASELAFFKDHGLFEPRRCRDCRAERRAREGR